MKRHAFFLGLILAAAGVSGCAQMLSPYGYGPAYRPYPIARPPVLPVDQIAAARGRWDQVMRLPAGSTIDVLTADGAAHVGHLIGVDGYSVRVMVGALEQQVTRADVLRVDLLDLPGSEVGAVAKRAATGAILGVGAAALVGAVVGGAAWPPPGALLRGGAAIGGVAGGQAALAERQRRLVYVAENQLRMGRPSAAFDPGESESVTILESHRVHAWPAISALRAGDLLHVVRTNGWRHRGRLIGVDDSSLRLDIDGAELRITRESIVRVDVVDVRENVPQRRRETRIVPRPNASIAGASIGSFSPQGFVAPGAAPLVRMGLPMLPFGGAQPQVFQFQIASNHLMPTPGSGPLPSATPAARPMRASICQGSGVRMR